MTTVEGAVVAAILVGCRGRKGSLNRSQGSSFGHKDLIIQISTGMGVAYLKGLSLFFLDLYCSKGRGKATD